MGGARHSRVREGDSGVAEEDRGHVWGRFLVWGQSSSSWTWGLCRGVLGTKASRPACEWGWGSEERPGPGWWPERGRAGLGAAQVLGAPHPWLRDHAKRGPL